MNYVNPIWSHPKLTNPWNKSWFYKFVASARIKNSAALPLCFWSSDSIGPRPLWESAFPFLSWSCVSPRGSHWADPATGEWPYLEIAVSNKMRLRWYICDPNHRIMGKHSNIIPLDKATGKHEADQACGLSQNSYWPFSLDQLYVAPPSNRSGQPLYHQRRSLIRLSSEKSWTPKTFKPI